MNTRASWILGLAAAMVLASAGASSAIDVKKPKAPGKPGASSGAAAKSDAGESSDDGTQFALSDSGKTVTHDCKGGQAAINGNKNVLKLKNCAQTSLNGNNNSLDVTGVESLAVTGNDNVVTYLRKAGGDEPAVADGGSRNKITGK